MIIHVFFFILRELVPGVDKYSDKTDVFEMTAQYVSFIKRKVKAKAEEDGNSVDLDKEFVKKTLFSS